MLDWIEPYLAIGPKPRLQSTRGEGPTWENLTASGITQVIDLTGSDVERRYAGTYKVAYNCAKVRDHPEPRELFAVFETVNILIEKEKEAGGKVYLHCLGGTGRSPTCAMAHLMSIGKSMSEARDAVRKSHPPTWKDESIENMERALHLWGKRLDQKEMKLFLDHQTLGLKPFLTGTGREVRDVTEISGEKDTSRSIDDDSIVDHLKKHPELLLITKDTGLAAKCENQNLTEQLMYIDESETVVKEVFRRLALNATGETARKVSEPGSSKRSK